jgi:hypothetical protein
VPVTGAFTTTTLVRVSTRPSAAVLNTTFVELERVKETSTLREVSVTSPPPIVLKTTPPSTVVTGVASGGVVGATAMVVGSGVVEAVMSSLRAEEMDASWVGSGVGVEEEEVVGWGGGVEEVVGCWVVVGCWLVVVLVVESGTVPLSCLLRARWTSFVAITGAVEWTCSIA